MERMNGKIIKATAEELRAVFNGSIYKAIIEFEEFLEYCKINGTQILKAEKEEEK